MNVIDNKAALNILMSDKTFKQTLDFLLKKLLQQQFIDIEIIVESIAISNRRAFEIGFKQGKQEGNSNHVTH